MSREQFGESFFCPLSHEVFVDPVIDHEGNSYEKASILEWLAKDRTSPITRAPLKPEDLSPNRALRDLVEQRWKELGLEAPKKPVSATIPATQTASNATSATPQDATITVKTSSAASGNDRLVLTKIVTPSGVKRTPSDICCVVDVSGSMGADATVKNDSGVSESHGLSVLDIVKHAVKTIVATLQEGDRLALVTYSTKAKTHLDLQLMDDASKDKALKIVEAWHTEDSTNIWDGLKLGLDLLRAGAKPGRSAALLLLTDGEANISPPRGELAMLKKYKEDNKQLDCTVNTFGFGYNMNSKLLDDLSTEGDGMFSFIPDSSFVGTAFVNALANLLVVMSKHCQLALEPLGGAKILEVVGGFSHVDASWGTLVNLCSLQHGQSKDLVVKMSVPNPNAPYLNTTLKYQTFDSDKPLEIETPVSGTENDKEATAQYNRAKFVDIVRSAMGGEKPAQVRDALHKAIVAHGAIVSASLNDTRTIDLAKDINGQAEEATSKDEFWNKWGRHYLPSLTRAHQMQQCNNFKDPGVQHYGGVLFQQIRDEVDKIFLTLPPPKPSRSSYGGGYGGYGSAASSNSAPVNMNSYYNCSAPCFHGSSTVLMANNSLKQVKLLQRGDQVQTANGKSAEVLCVVKTHNASTTMGLVRIGDLLVTPYHPVRIENTWKFPCDVATPAEVECEAVFSFLLDEASEHVMKINDVECVTLGHNFKDSAVVAHPFFGSNLVVDALKRTRGWSVGLVEFSTAADCFVRDEKSTLVCGFQNELNRAAA